MAKVKMSSKTVHHKVIAFSVQYLPSLRNSSTVPSHHPNLSHLFIFCRDCDQKSPIRVCLPSTPFSFLVGTFLTGHRAFVRVVVTPYISDMPTYINFTHIYVRLNIHDLLPEFLFYAFSLNPPM